MTSWQRIADLHVRIESLRLLRREYRMASGRSRVTTTFALAGGGHVGHGEDVTYEAEEHDRLALAAPLPLAGRWTLQSLSERVATLPLAPPGAAGDRARPYTRWAIESAALDLALRQAQTSLGAALGREYAPIRFVASPPSQLERWHALHPALEFKVDASPEWTRASMAALAATGRVRVVDLKGHYGQTAWARLGPDPEIYGAVAELFPDAVIEDPMLTPETLAALEQALDRVSYDASIHGIDDLTALDPRPQWINIKPSRFGSTAALLDAIDWCAERGIRLYGGGQFELGVGRGQIQALASLFYPDGPNDVAPVGYNELEPHLDVDPSPLEPRPEPIGFGRLSG